MLYPKPAHNELTIASPGGITSAVISTITGQVLYNLLPAGSTASIDVSALQAGIYFIKINGTEIRKFVKE
ncbi:MAG: T9SS type A sorting domain-containing protein [Taibaiella sp.]|nr:T9SS type A sorting domain-containing protein [Taibaiella sp.]